MGRPSYFTESAHAARARADIISSALILICPSAEDAMAFSRAMTSHAYYDSASHAAERHYRRPGDAARRAMPCDWYKNSFSGRRCSSGAMMTLHFGERPLPPYYDGDDESTRELSSAYAWMKPRGRLARRAWSAAHTVALRQFLSKRRHFATRPGGHEEDSMQQI